MNQDSLILAYWSKTRMNMFVTNKFNQRGFVLCEKEFGSYSKICFGRKIDFGTWIEGLKKGDIFFDSGMYYGNSRNYSQWRGKNEFWKKLISETY